MTAELRAAVENAYGVFSRYAIGGALTVCHCNGCMTHETEHELRGAPLRHIPSKLLAEYTNSAHGWDDDAIAREMRYFLPRYFDLIGVFCGQRRAGADYSVGRCLT